jgi:hypothetical protein
MKELVKVEINPMNAEYCGLCDQLREFYQHVFRCRLFGDVMEEGEAGSLRCKKCVQSKIEQ